MKTILILGYKLLPSGNISNILKQRLNTGIKYYKKGDMFLVSGGKNRNVYHSEAYEMKKYLLQRIPNAKIISESHSISTLENIKFSKRILDIYNDKVVLVSSKNHLNKIRKIIRDLYPALSWNVVYK